MGKLSNILFFISMIFIVLVFVPLGSFRMPVSVALPISLLFGMIAFILSVLAVFFDRSKQLNFPQRFQNLVFYLGLMVIYVGLVFWIMHWPNSQFITIVGATIAGLSYILKFFLKEREEDLLDN